MLTSLDLMRVEVHLPALAEISKQLQELRLWGSHLRTDTAPGCRTDCFSSGWDCLEILDLTSAVIYAPLAGVSLPQLQLLSIADFSYHHWDILDGLKCRRAVQVETFAQGFCPLCKEVTFWPLCYEYSFYALGPSSCRGLTSLTSACLVWSGAELRDEDTWPAEPLPFVELPTSVTRLECKDRSSLPFHPGTSVLDLHAMLGLAAGCISAGVPLQSLCLLDCTSCTGWGEYEKAVEPTEDEYATYYGPVCRSLHGLTSLEFEYSSYNYQELCSLRALNEVVSCAPDLRYLCLGVTSKDAWSALDDPVHIQCSGLVRVRVNFDFASGRRRTIHFQLDNAAGLQQIVLGCVGCVQRCMFEDGTSLLVSMEIHRLAAVTAEYADASHPCIDVAAPGDSDGTPAPAQHAQLRRVTVSLTWEHCCPEDTSKMGWTCALRWDE
jgi:hypothetical protein